MLDESKIAMLFYVFLVECMVCMPVNLGNLTIYRTLESNLVKRNNYKLCT